MVLEAQDKRHLKRGDIVFHKLGIKCVVLNVMNKMIGPSKTNVVMLKCRYLANDGTFHKFEFFPEELS